MVAFLSTEEILQGIDLGREYFRPILAPKTFGYYDGVWKKLLIFAQNSSDSKHVDMRSFYEATTHTPAFEHPGTSWYLTLSRAIFVIVDLLQSREIPREYLYNSNTYRGIFEDEYNKYIHFRHDEGKSYETIRREKMEVANLLTYFESYGLSSLSEVTAEHLLCFLKSFNQNYSDTYKRSHAYTARRFLNCPVLELSFSYDIDTLLLGYRHKKHHRLESFYTTEEIKSVMDTVERETNWGKTIYAMMLLACTYGLRISDIRNLRFSSINWEARIIALYQIKTKKYVELPITDDVLYALLDYIKNVRPKSDDPHVFIRHVAPHIPYSSKDNFGDKVTAYFIKAGVNIDGKHHGLHSLRHSLATNLLGEDIPINEISSILGHSNAKSTKKYIWSDIKHLKCCALEVLTHDK